MKLILANNQSQKFVEFYDQLQAQSTESFEYAGYSSLLFVFNTAAEPAVQVINLAANKVLTDYDGVYINGYLKTYELAASVATACDALDIPYVNQEMRDAPSLSKLTMYAKLASAAVTLPRTIAGTKQALLDSQKYIAELPFPVVLKRADADRGIDNYKLETADQISALLKTHDDASLWLVQEFIPNEGFYLVSFYDQKPAFCIYRSLQVRPDGNATKAHMYKPKGGANADLIELEALPKTILDTCQQAVSAMNRQIASADCIYDVATDKAYVLEVNYNPQLVTIETFKDVRVQAFLDNLKNIGR